MSLPDAKDTERSQTKRSTSDVSDRTLLNRPLPKRPGSETTDRPLPQIPSSNTGSVKPALPPRVKPKGE